MNWIKLVELQLFCYLTASVVAILIIENKITLYISSNQYGKFSFIRFWL